MMLSPSVVSVAQKPPNVGSPRFRALVMPWGPVLSMTTESDRYARLARQIAGAWQDGVEDTPLRQTTHLLEVVGHAETLARDILASPRAGDGPADGRIHPVASGALERVGRLHETLDDRLGELATAVSGGAFFKRYDRKVQREMDRTEGLDQLVATLGITLRMVTEWRRSFEGPTAIRLRVQDRAERMIVAPSRDTLRRLEGLDGDLAALIQEAAGDRLERILDQLRLAVKEGKRVAKDVEARARTIRQAVYQGVREGWDELARDEQFEVTERILAHHGEQTQRGLLTGLLLTMSVPERVTLLQGLMERGRLAPDLLATTMLSDPSTEVALAPGLVVDDWDRRKISRYVYDDQELFDTCLELARSAPEVLVDILGKLEDQGELGSSCRDFWGFLNEDGQGDRIGAFNAELAELPERLVERAPEKLATYLKLVHDGLRAPEPGESGAGAVPTYRSLCRHASGFVTPSHLSRMFRGLDSERALRTGPPEIRDFRSMIVVAHFHLETVDAPDSASSLPLHWSNGEARITESVANFLVEELARILPQWNDPRAEHPTHALDLIPSIRRASQMAGEIDVAPGTLRRILAAVPGANDPHPQAGALASELRALITEVLVPNGRHEGHGDGCWAEDGETSQEPRRGRSRPR